MMQKCHIIKDLVTLSAVSRKGPELIIILSYFSYSSCCVGVCLLPLLSPVAPSNMTSLLQNGDLSASHLV